MIRFATLLVCLCVPLSAHAALLGTTSHVYDGSVSPAQPHEAIFSLNFGGLPALFDDVVMTAASQGQVLTATAITDPDFVTIASDLTDGAADLMELWAFVGIAGFGATSPEQVWFLLGSVDFAGHSIDSITLTVDEISLGTSDNTTTLHTKITVRVFGDGTLPVATKTWGAVKAMYR